MSNRQLTPDALMAKADTACSSARAALLVSDAPVAPDIGRTHSGLIGAFGNFLVKNGPVSNEVELVDGPAINQSQPTP